MCKSFSSKSMGDEHVKDRKHTGEIVKIAQIPGKDTMPICMYKVVAASSTHF